MPALMGYFLVCLLLLGVLLWISHLRRQISILRLLSRQAQKEQEAVLSLIDQLGEKITSKIDQDETLKIIADYVVHATHAESGAIFILNQADGTLQARVELGPFPPLHEWGEAHMNDPQQPPVRILEDRIRLGEGIVGLVAKEGRPLLVTDAEADPRLPRHSEVLRKVHSIILCPLRVRGTVLGVLVVVNKLGETVFDSRDMALLQALADQAAVTVDLVKLYDVLADQQRIEHELSIAHEFQKMLLPNEFPQLPEYELHALSEAATTVGGDFFDFFEVTPNHWGLVVADVSGKGIPGALIMAMVRAVLRAEARGSLSPKEVLRRVNERVLADTTEGVFVTMTYGVLDLRTRRLRFVRAGHEPLLIIGGRDQQVAEVSAEGIALGLVDDTLFDKNEEAEIQLRPGEVALLYTDGVIEAIDQSNKEYGRERLINRLQMSEDPTAPGLIGDIMKDIHQFTLGIPQHDDITMLALRVLPRTEAVRQTIAKSYRA
jgi:sigma-B regulation protein RsbU (phosphoserine phosphatase)